MHNSSAAHLPGGIGGPGPINGPVCLPARGWDHISLSEHLIPGLGLQGVKFQGVLSSQKLNNNYSYIPSSVELFKDKEPSWIEPASGQECNQGQRSMGLPLGAVT